MMLAKIPMHSSWHGLLEEEFGKPYMVKLAEFLAQQKSQEKIIYPREEEIFFALNETPFDQVEVVILGQDPYHGEGQAHGLSFSVKSGVQLPPSLQNMYKEIEAEYGTKMPRKGDLTGWAEQGVLLLNATLTVQQSTAGSHQKKGWEQFTDAVIRLLNEQGNNIVFMLWGAYAQKKGVFIDRKKHFVLESAHPSPLSVHRGFLGNGHFKKANDYLEAHGRNPIDWYKVQ